MNTNVAAYLVLFAAIHLSYLFSADSQHTGNNYHSNNPFNLKRKPIMSTLTNDAIWDKAIADGLSSFDAAILAKHEIKQIYTPAELIDPAKMLESFQSERVKRSRKSAVIPDIPIDPSKVQKVAKPSRWTQREGESTQAFELRRDTHRQSNKASLAKARAKHREQAYEKALAIRIQSARDSCVALAHPAAHPSRINRDATLDQMAIALQTRDATIAQIDKYGAVVQALPKRLAGTKAGQDIVRALTEDVKPVSRATGKIKRPVWETGYERTLRNLRVYEQIRSSSPWRISRAIPIVNALRNVSHSPNFAPTASPIAPTAATTPKPQLSTIREELHTYTVSARFHQLAQTCEATATPINR